MIVTVECALAMTQKKVADWMESEKGLIVLISSGWVNP